LAISTIGCKGEHELQVRWDSSGIWEGLGVEKGTIYKYKIQSNNNGIITEKADPFALYCEHPPQTASVIWDSTTNGRMTNG
jgi:1,4-alpha-glucan branching enzyme